MMTFEQVEYIFGKGVDTKTERRLVQPPYCLELENGIFTKTKGIKLRNGYEQIADIDSGLALLNFENEILAINDQTLYAFSEASQEFQARGGFDKFNLEFFTASSGPSTQTHAVVAVSPTEQVLTVWTDQHEGAEQTVRAKVTSPQGTVIKAEFSVDNGTGINFFDPICFAMTDRFVILYNRDSDNHLLFKSIPYVGLILSAPVDLSFKTLASGTYSPELERIIISYVDGANNHNAALLDNLGNLTFETTISSDGASITRICVIKRLVVSLPEEMVLYVSSGTIKAVIIDSNASVVVPAFVVDSTTSTLDKPTGIFNGVDWRLYWVEKNGVTEGNTSYIKTTVVTTSGTVSTLSTYLLDRVIANTPVLIDNIIYFSTFQYTVDEFLVEYELINGEESPHLVATLVRETAVANDVIAEIAESSEKWYIPQLSTASGFIDSTFAHQPNVVIHTFEQAPKITADALEKSIHIGGPHVISYDGVNVVEAGLPVADEIVSSVPTVGINAYLYVITYSWINNKGVLIEGSPSDIFTASNVQTPITIEARTLKLTDKVGVKINLYRSVDQGSDFFLAAQLENDPMVETVTFTDTVSDSTLLTRARLYTLGGVLPNDPVPQGNIIKVQGNRLGIAGIPEEPSSFRFSKLGLATAFPEEFVIPVRPDDGDVLSGLAKLDEYWLLFKHDSIFIVSGTGPDDTGLNNDFVLRRVASDVGCIDPRSILETERYVLFKSRKGIYSIDRGLKVDYIGAPVEAFNSFEIISSTIYPEMNEARFVTDGEYILIYNYFIEAWSIFTKFDAVSSTLFNNTYFHMKESGIIYREFKSGEVTDFNDNGRAIRMRIRTPWLWINNQLSLKRYKRIALLSEYSPDGIIAIGLHYDYLEGIQQLVTFDPEELRAYGTGSYGSGRYSGNGVIDLRSKIRKQKAQSISLEIIFDNANKDFTFSGLVMEAGVKKGLKQAKVA